MKVYTPYPATNSEGIVINRGYNQDGYPIGPECGESVEGWTLTVDGWVSPRPHGSASPEGQP